MIPKHLDGAAALELIADIHDIMNGERWSSDTTQAIGDLLVGAGFVFEEPADD